MAIINVHNLIESVMSNAMFYPTHVHTGKPRTPV